MLRSPFCTLQVDDVITSLRQGCCVIRVCVNSSTRTRAQRFQKNKSDVKQTDHMALRKACFKYSVSMLSPINFRILINLWGYMLTFYYRFMRFYFGL